MYRLGNVSPSQNDILANLSQHKKYSIYLAITWLTLYPTPIALEKGTKLLMYHSSHIQTPKDRKYVAKSCGGYRYSTTSVKGVRRIKSCLGGTKPLTLVTVGNKAGLVSG